MIYICIYMNGPSPNHHRMMFCHTKRNHRQHNIVIRSIIIQSYQIPNVYCSYFDDARCFVSAMWDFLWHISQHIGEEYLTYCWQIHVDSLYFPQINMWDANNYIMFHWLNQQTTMLITYLSCGWCYNNRDKNVFQPFVGLKNYCAHDHIKLLMSLLLVVCMCSYEYTYIKSLLLLLCLFNMLFECG